MEAVSVVIRRRPNSLEPVVENMFQFRRLKLVQKRQNAIKKSLGQMNHCLMKARLNGAKSLKSGDCKARQNKSNFG
jgi:hypothetical protein